MRLEQLLKSVPKDTFCFDTYIITRNNYAHALYQEAIRTKDFKRMSFHAFMKDVYFNKGYDHAYTQYYLGQRHKPKWGEL